MTRSFDTTHINGHTVYDLEQRWRLALETSGLGVWDWCPQSQQVYFSEQWQAMLGYGKDELTQDISVWVALLHPDEQESVLAKVYHYVDSVALDHESFSLEYRLRCKNGAYRWVAAQGRVVERNDYGQALRFIGTHADIQETKLLHERTHYLSFYDQLTGLPNRLMLVDLASRLLDRAQRIGDPVAICVMDVDQFKLINDALGYEQGNTVLAQLAQRVQSQLRSSDLVCRLSGDNFALFLSGLDESGVRAFISRLKSAVDQPFSIVGGGQPFYIRFSIGIAFSPADGKTIHVLLHHAEEAMYEAKNLGGNQLFVFNADISHRLQRRVQLEVGLRTALVNADFDLSLQPKIALETGRLVGFEALMRWYHPDEGVISPAEFIPVAEQTGLIVPMGNWILEQVIQLLAQWKKDGLPLVSVAVNLSPVQFRQGDLASHIAELLTYYEIDGCWLHLEVTESMLLQDQLLAGQMIAQLHGLGVSWALDDFGVGCSNFAYLQAHSFDVLKIDRQFVEGLADNRQQRAIVLGMIELSHALDMHVLAEGGSLADVSVLRQLGCDQVQSFSLAEPLTVQQASRLCTEKEMPWQSLHRMTR